MPKNSIKEYSATAALNSDIGGIQIKGSDDVANFDNALREQMSHLADMNAGTSPLHDTFTLADPKDTTKRVRIDAGNVGTGQTRIINMPNEDVDLGKLKTDLGKLKTDLGKLKTEGGAGQIGAFAMNTAPAGWLKATGATISRKTYANLFAAIGTTFGSGDGSTTFKIPDLRGEFIRGIDDSRGIDSGRVFGSVQADELKAHTHGWGSAKTAPDGAGIVVAQNSNTNYGTTASTGGSETRPRNIALLYCIKY